jgi:transcriptional regulator with XRE-family HTH domain
MNPTPKRIGRRLKLLREAKGFSQAAVAKEAGITREYVNKLEAGRYDPTVGVLTRLAKALGVDVKELL